MTDQIGWIKAALAAKQATQVAEADLLRQRYEELSEFPRGDVWINTQRTIEGEIGRLNSQLADTGVHFVLSVAHKKPSALGPEYIGRGYITATTPVGTRLIVLAVNQIGFIEITPMKHALADETPARLYEMEKTDAGGWRDILLGILDQITAPPFGMRDCPGGDAC